MPSAAYESDYFQESMCVHMRVHTQTVSITYATQVHTANTRYIMAIIRYHFSNFAGPQIFMGTSIINHAIFLIDNLNGKTYSRVL